jgi:hypothetical protein
MQITIMEKNKRGDPSKDHQLLFYCHLVPDAAANARGIMCSLQTKTCFDFPKKQDMIWLSNYFPHCDLTFQKLTLQTKMLYDFSKNTNHDLA